MKKTKTKTKKYPSHYLAAALAIVLLLEGTLFSISTPKDWQNAVSILDVSSAVSEAVHDTATLFQPQVKVFLSSEKFYELAADQMQGLLVFSYRSMSLTLSDIYDGVSDFYAQSSTQLAELLGAPIVVSHPSVSGASISK